MSERHGLSHRQPYAQTGFQPAAAGQDLQAQQSVHRDARSIREPTHKEAEHQCDGSPDRPSLLPLAPQWASGQPGDNDAVTHQEHQSGDHQTHQYELEVEDCDPERSIVFWIEPLAQSGPLSSFLSAGKYEVWHCQQASRQPGTYREEEDSTQ